LVLFTGLLLSRAVVAADPDFLINFSSCKNLIAPMSLSENPLRLVDGDPTVLSCNRQGMRLSCSISFEGGKQGIKGTTGQYEVSIDVPPTLAFKLLKGNEYILVNTTEHTAVMSSLVLNAEFAGSKVCHGMYMTTFELKNLPKK
jgi:hypothetical protein